MALNENPRFEALRIASGGVFSDTPPAEEVVARAQAYYEFLDPTVDVKAAPPTSASLWPEADDAFGKSAIRAIAEDMQVPPHYYAASDLPPTRLPVAHVPVYADDKGHAILQRAEAARDKALGIPAT